jgi:hypothetical protein
MVRLSVAGADALAFEADVLAVKYAQALYGVDLLVAEKLSLSESRLRRVLKDKEAVESFDSRGQLGVRSVLFVAVEPLLSFRYEQIRDFSQRAVSALATIEPPVEHLALTLHGPGYGLDEAEAFASEVAGVLDALKAASDLPSLRQITFVELNTQRARRLKQQLHDLVPGGVFDRGGQSKKRASHARNQVLLQDVGSASEQKPYVFVAMPFSDEMEDEWELGIRPCVTDGGLLCERADLTAFTGDVVDWVKSRIDGATFVVADLTGHNANVYLEVGYAWGRERPTILLARKKGKLKFNVQGQRCLLYNNITHMKRLLSAELAALGRAN